MRLSLFILGVFSALISIENPPRRKTNHGASIKMTAREIRSAGTRRWNNAWPTASATAPVHPVRTHPRRGHRVDVRAATLSNDHGLRESLGRNFAIFAAKCRNPIPQVLEATPGIEPG